MDLRRLTLQDFDAYRELRLLALQDAPTAFGVDYSEELESGSEFMRERLHPEFPSSAVFGAFESDGGSVRMVGMVGLFRDARIKTGHRAGIWGVFTLPSHRGRGISVQLLRMALHHAQELWRSRIVLLTVEAGNEPAKSLYRKLGFRSWGIEPKALLVDGRFYDEEHMILE